MNAKLDIVLLQCGLSDLTTRYLKSVRDTYSDCRVILVDNGSPLEDVWQAAEWLNHDDILIENPTNLGFAKAVNQGLKVATAPFVCIQNNDTIMGEHGYDRLITHLERNRDFGIVGPITNNADTAQRVPTGYTEGTEYGAPWLASTTGLVAFFCVVIPGPVIEKVGLLSEEYGLGYGEDDDYCIRLRQAGYKLGIARDVYVHHEHHVTYRHLVGDIGIDELGEQGLAVLREKYEAFR